jgi:hypothetical protein
MLRKHSVGIIGKENRISLIGLFFLVCLVRCAIDERVLSNECWKEKEAEGVPRKNSFGEQASSLEILRHMAEKGARYANPPVLSIIPTCGAIVNGDVTCVPSIALWSPAGTLTE